MFVRLVANCPDNQFPHVNLTIEGVASRREAGMICARPQRSKTPGQGAHADVLPPERLQELQTNLAGHPEAWREEPDSIRLALSASDMSVRRMSGLRLSGAA